MSKCLEILLAVKRAVLDERRWMRIFRESPFVHGTINVKGYR